MKDKTEIRYWLKNGEEEISILATNTTKVPEVGEVINFDHNWDEERAGRIYSDLSEQHKKTFFPKQEKLIAGDFIITSVKRYIKLDYIKTKVTEAFEGAIAVSNSTSICVPEIPVSYTRESFEVFIQPLKN